jgi:hypothetical protein
LPVVGGGVLVASTSLGDVNKTVGRLGLILMGASLFVLAFGVLVNGLVSLNQVLDSSHAYVTRAR